MVGENNGGEWSDASRWQGFLHRRYPGVSVVVAAGERPFLARYRSWNLHNIEFAEIHSAVAQDLRVAQPSVQAPDSWYLPLQLSGGFRVGQCEHEFGAEAGSMTILDSRLPHWRHIDAGSRLLNVRIPKRSSGQPLAVPALRSAIPIRADTGAARVVRDFIVSLWRRRSEIDAVQHAGLVDALVQLVAGLATDLAATDSRASVAPRRRELRRQRLLEFVDAHLADSHLDVGFVASACGMSTRYVHALMSASGCTFSSYVRERRLERARLALEQDVAARGPITAIALECGFTDMSWFASAFRRRFGMTPSAWRRRHA